MPITNEELHKLMDAGRKNAGRHTDAIAGVQFEIQKRIHDELGLSKEVRRQLDQVEAAQLRIAHAFLRSQSEGGVKTQDAIDILSEHQKMGVAALQDPKAKSMFAPQKIREFRAVLDGLKQLTDTLSRSKSIVPKMPITLSSIDLTGAITDWRYRQILGKDYERYMQMYADVNERINRLGRPERRPE